MKIFNWYNNFKHSSYKWRSKYFRPFLKLLAELKITPNGVTSFRLLFILPLAYFFYLNNLWGVLIIYSLFWFFDLIDGSLARYLNIQNDKGRFLDTLVDNFTYAFLILGFIYLHSALAWLLAFNIILELTVQILAIIKKRAKEKSDWLINAQADLPYFKTLAHLALIFYFFGYNILNSFFVLINLLLLIVCLYYFFIIKERV